MFSFFFFRVKGNITKCEIARIGVQLTFGCMKCTNLINEAIKLLGTFFAHKNKIKE